MDKQLIATPLRQIYRQLIGDRWSELYALRALGMAMILIRHAWVYAGRPAVMIFPEVINFDVSGVFRASALGTTFIFVLAGFLNHLPYERAQLRGAPPPPFVPFMKRRLIRLVPVYYVCILAGILASGGIDWLRLPGALHETVLSFGFIHSFLPQAWYTLQGGNWAVEAVVQFYVMVPVLAYMLTRKRWQISVVVMFIAVIAYRAYISQPHLDGVYLEHQLWARFDHFLIGMLAAKYVATNESRGSEALQPAWFGRVAFGLGLLMFMLMADGASDKPSLTATWLVARIGFALAAACAVIYLVQSPRGVVHRIASSTFVVSIGMIGYSIFMWQLFVFRGLQPEAWFNALAPLDRLAYNLSVGIALTLALSVISFIVLEFPFLKRKRIQSIGV